MRSSEKTMKSSLYFSCVGSTIELYCDSYLCDSSCSTLFYAGEYRYADGLCVSIRLDGMALPQHEDFDWSYSQEPHATR